MAGEKNLDLEMDSGSQEEIEDLKRRLGKTKDELEDLLDSHGDYARRMLKFSLASWIFSLSVFISFLLIYYGPSPVLNPPPLSISLLIGALAVAIIIAAGLLAKRRSRIKELKEKRKKFESAYQKNLLEFKYKKTEERKEFLNTLLRHDLRNKSQVVLGYLELAEDYDLSEELENLLSKAREANQEGIEIIEKVRTLRKVEQAEETGEVELCSILENTVDKFEKIFEEDIELEHRKEEMMVKGGPLLEELFSNLLENAVEHGDCDKVRITREELDGEIVVKVEDDGKGILDDSKEKIFEKGYKDKKTGGSGLGLYLVKQIAEAYEGSVEVKDSELGGARFDVCLEKA